MFRKQRWIFGALLMLITSAIFADSNPQITSDAVTNHTDLSMNFLSQLFGTVGNVLTGTSGQMMGKLFYDLNVGILVVAGLWLSYTIFTVVISSTTEGSFVSGRNNIAIIFLRIAIGTGALLPSPTTGYNVIQDVVMKVVVEGVKLADMTWSHGLDYIQQGGDVWHAPVTSKDGGGLDNDTAHALYTGVVSSVMKSEVCMLASSARRQMQSQSRSGGNSGIANNSIPPDTLSPIDNKSGMVFNFPSDKSNTTGCGQLNWGAVPGASTKDPSGKKIASTEGEYAYEASYHVVYNLLPAAKLYVCSQYPSYARTSVCSGVSTSDSASNASEIAFNNLLAYVNSVQPLVANQTSQAQGKYTDFLETAKKVGWLSAGRYSYDIAHFKDTMIDNKEFAKYQPVINMPTDNNPSSYKSNPFDPWSQSVWTGVQKKLSAYTGASNAGNTGSSSATGDGKDLRWLAPVVGALLSYQQGFNKLFDGQHMGYDPMYFLHRVGVESMNIAGEIWINLAITIGALYLIGIVCSGASVDLDRPIEGAINWFKPLAMTLAMLYLTTGGLLAFYVPLYAFLVFSFGVIAWFIAVIEAMVAAPLVAFRLTHPEGHDFLGPIQQSLMLLLGIFLRPVLTVIGLIAAMILSYVSFRMINWGFASFMGDVLGHPGANSGNVYAGISSFMSHTSSNGDGLNFSKLVGPLIGMPVMLFFYAMIVFYVVNQCYSLVYVLPDYIMRWIGGPTSQSTVGQMMQGLQQGVQSNMGSLGQGMGQSADNVLGSVKAAGSAGIKAGLGASGGEADQKKKSGPKDDGGGDGAGGGDAAELALLA